MIETVEHKAEPWPTGFLWPLRNGDSWSAPEINNGLPYMPDYPQWLKNIFWYCRNPFGNASGYIMGVQGYDYTVTGKAPVMLTTLYDADPHQYGWSYAYIKCGWLYLPYIAYSGKRVLWYWGWRPYSGGLGLKFNIHL